MGKRKVKVEAKPSFYERWKRVIEDTSRTKKKSAPKMSDERMMDVLTDSLASLADLRAAGPPAVKELRRLRAEIVALQGRVQELGGNDTWDDILEWMAPFPPKEKQ